MLKPLNKFRTAESGLAALEFSMALPVLLVALLGSFEIDRYVSMTRRLEFTASSIAEMLTQSQDGLITPVDVTFAQDSTMVLFPNVLADSVRKGIAWTNDIALSMSSIVFSKVDPKCTSNCVYNAQVAWSSGANAVSRPCNKLLQPVADTQATTPTTLASDAFGPVPLIAVDLAFNYTPLFGSKFLPQMTIRRSAFMAPRYTPGNAYLKYAVAGGDSLVTTCKGF